MAIGDAPVRVVHVLSDFHTGGMERGVLRLIREASPGFVHSLVVQRNTGNLVHLLPQTTKVVNLRKKPGNSVTHLWRMGGAIRALEPDVVHTRNWMGIDAVLASRLRRVKGIVHGEHGWGTDDPNGANPKRRRIRKFASRWVREFTCVSRHIRDWLANDIGVKSPVTQIYNGVNTDRFSPGPGNPEIRRELGIAPDDFLIAFIGRFDPIKDIPTLYRAFTRLRKTRDNVRMVLVGYGFDEDKIRATVPDGALVAGLRDDVPDVLRTANAFALSSLNEGISNSILEAMSAGLPTVVTHTGGNPELVTDGKTGRLFRVGDDESLANILAEWVDNPKTAAELGRAAREDVLARFSITAMVQQYEAVSARVAAAKRKS